MILWPGDVCVVCDRFGITSSAQGGCSVLGYKSAPTLNIDQCVTILPNDLTGGIEAALAGEHNAGKYYYKYLIKFN